MARCVLLFPDKRDKNMVLYDDVARIFTFIIPMFLILISVVLSIRVTLQSADRTMKMQGSERGELQRTRNRATITILLFAAVYAVLNVPLVVSEILHTIDYNSKYIYDFHSFDYDTKYMLYYDNFVSMLSVSLNAAINPALYLWRMNNYQHYVKDKSRRFSTVSQARTRRIARTRRFTRPLMTEPAVSDLFAMNRDTQLSTLYEARTRRSTVVFRRELNVNDLNALHRFNPGLYGEKPPLSRIPRGTESRIPRSRKTYDE
jgi:hypothetical protein